MKLRNKILGGAAMMALVGTGAFAGESTPAEKAATQRLNIEAQTYAKGVPAEQALPASVAPPFVDYAAVAQPPAAAADMSSTPLSTVERPLPSIANATVVSSDGQTVGLVQKVALDGAGKPTSVDVALKDGGKTVSFSALEMTYDAEKNVITVAGTSDQIMSKPGTPAG